MGRKYALYKQALYFSLLTASSHQADFRGRTGNRTQSISFETSETFYAEEKLDLSWISNKD